MEIRWILRGALKVLQQRIVRIVNGDYMYGKWKDVPTEKED